MRVLTLIAEVLEAQRDELGGCIEGVFGRSSITLGNILSASRLVITR
jgi:hypothetical protein